MGKTEANPDYDVLVLGSGLAGSITATILARRGHRVALIERGTHPRLAIGESLIPTSAMWFWILGQKHDIPEITTLAHLDSICREVAPTSGVKRGFGYVYHREGQESVSPDESSIFISALQPIFRESQLYRQDVDQHLVEAATRYGVVYRDRTTVESVDQGPEAMTVRIAGGEEVTARFVVDASGRSSVLAQRFGLREEPSRLRHSSRTIFSHLEGVAPFEDIAPDSLRRPRSASWSHGTLHHVFDGGWFWVIPFDNHDRSASDLVSVGLTLDTGLHPRPPDVDPEAEFWSFVDRFPAVARHLRPARPALPFIGTDRLQYSSTTSVGDRFVLLQHAYGFIDPLFSRGIWRTLETVDAVCRELLAALDDDGFGAERFAAIDRMQAAMLDDNDQMVWNAFRSMASYDTWTAWLRVWFADELMHTLPVLAATFRHATEGDLAAFDRIDGDPRPGCGYSFARDLQRRVGDAEAHLDRVERGQATPAEARRAIIGLLERADYLPPDIIDWGSPDDFSIDLTPPTLAKLIWWGRVRAPRPVRDEAFDYSLRKLGALQIRDAIRPGSLRRDPAGNVVSQRG